jgi:hypothetical protein
MSPEQGQRPRWLPDNCVPTGRHGVTVDARAWHLSCLILAGRGPNPAPVVTAGGTAPTAGAPGVAACI